MKNLFFASLLLSLLLVLTAFSFNINIDNFNDKALKVHDMNISTVEQFAWNV